MDMTESEYTQAVTFWSRKDAAEQKMEPAEIRSRVDEFLSSHNVLALAAGGASFLRCTPLEYSWQDGALWIFTEGGLKFRALRENAHVAAAVFDADGSFGSLASIQLEGEAEIVRPFSDEYVRAAAFRQIPLESLKKLPEPMWLLKIVPTEMTFLNSAFRREGFCSREIWHPGE